LEGYDSIKKVSHLLIWPNGDANDFLLGPTGSWLGQWSERAWCRKGIGLGILIGSGEIIVIVIKLRLWFGWVSIEIFFV
jgi:hypothetical protein